MIMGHFLPDTDQLLIIIVKDCHPLLAPTLVSDTSRYWTLSRMADPSSPRLRAVSEFGTDFEGFLQHVKDFRGYTQMKDRMDSIRRAMHIWKPPSVKIVSEPETSIEPKSKSKYAPKPELEPALKAEYELEVKNGTEPELLPKYEPESEPMPESDSDPEPTSKLENLHDSFQNFGESFVVKRTESLRPDLQFCSLEQDLVVQCQDASVTAPSLLLALLAPWMGEVLQAGKGQKDNITNSICPGLGAGSLRRFLADVAARKEEIDIGEDVRSLFCMNQTFRRTETNKNVEIKELPVDENTDKSFIKLKTNSEEREAILLENRNKYKAKYYLKNAQRVVNIPIQQHFIQLTQQHVRKVVEKL